MSLRAPLKGEGTIMSLQALLKGEGTIMSLRALLKGEGTVMSLHGSAQTRMRQPLFINLNIIHDGDAFRIHIRLFRHLGG
jgi:hypothetical protein